MLLEAVYHRPKQNWAYAYDHETLHIRLRTKRDDVQKVEILFGDKFIPFENNMQTKPMERFTQDAMFDYWQAEVIPPFRRLCYGFILNSGKQKVWMTEKGFFDQPPTEHLGLFEFPFLNPIDVFTPPSWVKDAVFYQIFPERFANGDPSNDPANVLPWGGKPEYHNFFGGDLQGVIDHLDYLTDLGINAIYFTPIFEATTNHKYDTRDYLKVDPHFGTNETLKELVNACHERGIRVLLDAVFNHSGATFPPFVDVLEKGHTSKYADWFHVREFPLRTVNHIPTFDTFAFTDQMPKLNTENPEVKEYLLKVAKYWVEEVGIDGWRLDVANEVDHHFWREFREVVKAANPEAYILGEVFHDSIMWLQGDQFDAVMNYPFQGTLLDFFARNTMDGASFASSLNSQLARYPQQANEVAFNLLDSHDTQRLLTLCEGDKRKMKLAVLFQLTFPGTPCIYYGDEIGMDGSYDPDCRKCMEWDESKQDRELFRFYQRLISLRKENKLLRSGGFRFLHAKKDDNRLVYERWDNDERIMIVINNNKRSSSISVSVQTGLASSEQWTDVLTGETVRSVNGKLKVKLPPFGYQILRNQLSMAKI
ncbi:alpha-glycosidase [Paenibacillus sediminis]|uniref:Glycosidase n=1 Tax=Paenibacillus sediminis TaxID=664909 RepID=A0ABS4H355_9BACL|nr:alpha-glycosidase [Paenibacillus sediminis]MBP1936961.1 glycosidase [Paenibacillus sediminis]